MAVSEARCVRAVTIANQSSERLAVFFTHGPLLTSHYSVGLLTEGPKSPETTAAARAIKAEFCIPAEPAQPSQPLTPEPG